MEIVLTKKLAAAMNLKPNFSDECENPLFSWTANWTKTWSNRHKEDLLVLMNNATRFAVAVYQVKPKDIGKVNAEMMVAAIRNTFLALNLNPEIIDEYLEIAGGVFFTLNRNRQTAAWVTRAGLHGAFYAGRKYEPEQKVFDDAVAAPANLREVGDSVNPEDGFMPCDAMFSKLAEITGKPIYKYRAFELLVTLDLDIYKAARRLIVPANIKFTDLHDVLQHVFAWKNRHLHEFTVFNANDDAVATLAMDDKNLEYAEGTIIEGKHTLSEFFPQYKHMVYTYDLGDYWRHRIELTRVIEEHDADSPYVVEGAGQAPPEDVGGVGGFVRFRDIMLNPEHEEYENTKNWVGYWRSEFEDYAARPGVVARWR